MKYKADNLWNRKRKPPKRHFAEMSFFFFEIWNLRPIRQSIFKPNEAVILDDIDQLVPDCLQGSYSKATTRNGKRSPDISYSLLLRSYSGGRSTKMKSFSPTPRNGSLSQISTSVVQIAMPLILQRSLSLFIIALRKRTWCRQKHFTMQLQRIAWLSVSITKKQNIPEKFDYINS